VLGPRCLSVRVFVLAGRFLIPESGQPRYQLSCQFIMARSPSPVDHDILTSQPEDDHRTSQGARL